MTNLLPNFFEDDAFLPITYLKINIEDRKEVEIDLAFPACYHFIDEAFNMDETQHRNSEQEYFFDRLKHNPHIALQPHGMIARKKSRPSKKPENFALSSDIKIEREGDDGFDVNEEEASELMHTM